MSAPTLDKILQAVNEKYGTSLEGWSQLPSAYEVGDTVPNWNAYEKIEKPIRKISANFPPNLYGYLQGDTCFLATHNEKSCVVDAETGQVTGEGPTISQGFDTYVIGKLEGVGINVTSAVGYEVNLEVGDYVPNWNEYENVL